MAAFLNIKGKEIEAKCTFGFASLADKKYSIKSEKSDEENGFETIYGGLLEAENKWLVAFWDCATTYLSKNDKPTVEDIQQALEDRFEEDGDTQKSFEEAYEAIDQSAFFKRKAQKFWKNVELMKNFGATEEEKRDNKMLYDRMIEARNEISGSI